MAIVSSIATHCGLQAAGAGKSDHTFPFRSFGLLAKRMICILSYSLMIALI